MFLVPIALIIIVIDFVQFISCIALSCIHVDVVLNVIITKQKCSIFCIKKSYKKGTYYMKNLNFKLKKTCRYCK